MEPVASEEPKYCTNCGTKLLPGSNFCNVCGMPQKPNAVPPQPAVPYAPYVPPRTSTMRDLVMGLGVYGVIALAALMAVNVAIALWGIDLVLPHLDKHIYLFIITPFIVNFAELGGWAFMGYYIFLVGAIAACFAWMLYKSARPLADEIRLKYPKEGHSPLYIMGTVLFATLSLNVIYYLIVGAFGESPSTPSFDTRALWELIYGYAQASVWEELVSRVLLIGIPLLVIDSLIRQRNPGHKMEKWYHYILGGGFTIGRKEALLMAFSSAMFGAAHVFAWDLFKVLPAAAAGLAFAYLYLKVGLYASVMMHFATDFMTIPLNVWSGTGVTTIVGLLVLAWLFLGVPYMVLYISKGLGWILGRRVWPDVPPQPPQPAYAFYPTYAPIPVPAPVGYPNTVPSYPTAPAPRADDGHGFVCPNCGNQEAIYSEGKLVCTRCGTKR